MRLGPPPNNVIRLAVMARHPSIRWKPLPRVPRVLLVCQGLLYWRAPLLFFFPSQNRRAVEVTVEEGGTLGTQS